MCQKRPGVVNDRVGQKLGTAPDVWSQRGLQKQEWPGAKAVKYVVSVLQTAVGAYNRKRQTRLGAIDAQDLPTRASGDLEILRAATSCAGYVVFEVTHEPLSNAVTCRSPFTTDALRIILANPATGAPHRIGVRHVFCPTVIGLEP